MKQEMNRVIKTADVLVMTTAQTGLKAIRELPASITILDEAGQVTELNLNMVLDTRSTATVCVGDAKQPPSMQVTPWAEKMKIESGFQ